MLPLPATMEEARAALRGTPCRVLTDGKMGDLVQCLGVAEALGLAIEERVVKPRPPFSWLAPHGPQDPRDPLPVAAPFPAIAIASGRRAVPALRALKRASGGNTFAVFLKDPRIGAGAADFIWVPAHDGLRDPNVLATLTSPHRQSATKLAAARANAAPWPRQDQRPLVALLVGGPSKDFRFTSEDEARLLAGIDQVIAQGAMIVGTPSRRTPAPLAAALRARIESAGGWFWKGEGENPYPHLLARADAFIVTAESVNMLGEAAATGKPIYSFRPTGASRKIDHFLRGLEAHGALRPFHGEIESFTYPPLDSTPEIALELARRYLAFRSGAKT